MRIVLNGLVFNAEADVNGTQWMVTEWEGWDAPALRQSFGEATSRHGGVLLESLLGSRSVVLRGVCKAASESAFWVAYNGLLGLVNNLVVPKDLVVTEDVAKRLSVIRGGLPRLDFVGVGSFTFEIPLMAVDPLKYTVTTENVVIAAGATQVVNVAGTFPSWPIFTSSGIMNALHVESGLRVSTAPASMPAATVMDMNKRTLFGGGTNRYSSITAASAWWALQPGSNSVKNDGNASTTMTYNPAWI